MFLPIGFNVSCFKQAASINITNDTIGGWKKETDKSIPNFVTSIG